MYVLNFAGSNVKLQVLPALVMLSSEASVLLQVNARPSLRDNPPTHKLQAVYRGHLSRRGVKPLINVILSNHGAPSRCRRLRCCQRCVAGTSVFLHRVQMWPSGGQIYYAWAAFGWDKLMYAAAAAAAAAAVADYACRYGGPCAPAAPDRALVRYGGSRNFKMPTANDFDASGKRGAQHRGSGLDKHRASPLGKPLALNRDELANMNRLIARKMRGDLEAALEIVDESSLRTMDAAAAR